MTYIAPGSTTAAQGTWLGPGPAYPVDTGSLGMLYNCWSVAANGSPSAAYQSPQGLLFLSPFTPSLGVNSALPLSIPVTSAAANNVSPVPQVHLVQ